MAPVCLEDRAREVFDPGTGDRYMLFEHRLRGEWQQRGPTIVHVDGTTRLQTLGPDNLFLHALLRRSRAYRSFGNTSANFAGCGFFPTVVVCDAMCGTRYVWGDGVSYTDELNDASPSPVGELVSQRAG